MSRPAPRRLLRAETRRALAIFAVIVWVLGFEIGPGVHVGLHELWGTHAHEGDRAGDGRDHDHDHGHGHDHDHDHGHDHGHDHDHDHDHDHGDGDDGHGDGREAGIDRGDHGRHSLAHRGVAVLTPAPVIAAVASAPWVAAPWIDRYEDLILSRRPSATRARGPPVAVSIG